MKRRTAGGRGELPSCEGPWRKTATTWRDRATRLTASTMAARTRHREAAWHDPHRSLPASHPRVHRRARGLRARAGGAGRRGPGLARAVGPFGAGPRCGRAAGVPRRTRGHSSRVAALQRHKPGRRGGGAPRRRRVGGGASAFGVGSRCIRPAGGRRASGTSSPCGAATTDSDDIVQARRPACGRRSAGRRPSTCPRAGRRRGQPAALPSTAWATRSRSGCARTGPTGWCRRP